MNTRFQKIWDFFALFSSASTLLCCALPSLFVLLGAGAVFATLIEKFPFLITLSEHKTSLFLFSFVALLVAGYFQYRSRYLACPTDKNLAQSCSSTRKWSFVVYVFSCVLFVTGFVVTYLIPLLMN